MAEHYVEIHWTTGSIDEARKVARYLCQERLIACAQVIPWVESIYMWDNKLQTTQESKVVMKTRRDKFEAIKEVIQKNTTYEVPEIILIQIDDGNKAYFDWIEENTPEFEGS